MTVALLVVNWNGGVLLRRCLESVRAQRRPPDHIIIVDNGSADDSIRLAQESLSDAELIQLPQNVGFARANNIGAARARRFDALALLNPDTVVDAGWLEELARAAER